MSSQPPALVDSLPPRPHPAEMIGRVLKRHRIALALTTLALIAACARQPELISSGEDPGFFSGLFHGFTMIFALIFGFFDSEVAIYALPNSGWPYDVGYVIGAMIFFGGSGASAN